MEIITVGDLMVPMDEYATVDQEATLADAIVALEKAQELIDRDKRLYLHRAILVYGPDKKIVGKISQFDVLAALEPKYQEMGDMKMLSRAGFSSGFIKSMMERYAFCERPFTEMCRIAGDRKVKDIMYTPSEGEYVDKDISICEAVHQFVMGHHQSLLVKDKEDIVGILRLSDMFKFVYQTMQSGQVDL